MTTIGIIDYGVGNLGSLERAFEEVGGVAQLIDTAQALPQCHAAVLPGVGSFTDCMEMLDAGGWVSALKAMASEGMPVLGICAGMQLLANFGDEGTSGIPTRGLGLISGKVTHLRDRGCTFRVPHVGWNAVTPVAGAALFHEVPATTDVYFVHSYTFVPDAEETVLARTEYDISLVAAVGQGNVWGTQFHPEKSGQAGFQILRNFRALSGC